MANVNHKICCSLLLTVTFAASAQSPYQNRVDQVRRTPGFVAFWDFVRLDPSGARFDAWRGSRETADFSLDAVNYVQDYWGQGRQATYADFPLLGRGPFGEAVQFLPEKDPTFRPLLMVPRARLHNTGLDVKGARRSVSMVVWLMRETGNHAIAGIWHEGTDLHTSAGAPVQKVERGRRQYALFAGLAANNGASAVHVSENGAASFGDRYARNLAVTPELIKPGEWTVVGFTFDNARNLVTAYINGKANPFWIDDPLKHPFFQWPAKGWSSGEWNPPKKYIKTRVNAEGKRELTALQANPYWFPHDLYSPPTSADGGPFTIGRVIHTSRNVGFTGWIGGVAVFDRALSPKDMARLAAIAASGPISKQ